MLVSLSVYYFFLTVSFYIESGFQLSVVKQVQWPITTNGNNRTNHAETSMQVHQLEPQKARENDACDHGFSWF